MQPEIGKSEFIINEDGTIFHLHLRPEQISSKIILVGDPARVTQVASYFDSIECEVSNREFHTITGLYNKKRLTVLSHGIGGDNIDIVLSELDALANIDFETRRVNKNLKSLTLVRIGTSGALQPDIPLGSYVISEKAIGYENVLYFYKNNEKIRDLSFEEAFSASLGTLSKDFHPYVVQASLPLLNQIADKDVLKGITISANGFYGPQGRTLRIPLQEPDINKSIEAFSFDGKRICNYEMEGASLIGLAALMGHQAVTICCIIANRYYKEMNVNYKDKIDGLIKMVIDRI